MEGATAVEASEVMEDISCLSEEERRNAQLAAERSIYPNESELIDSIGKLLEKRLYYEATEKFFQYIKKIDLSKSQSYDFFYNVIFPISGDIRPLRTMQLLDLCISGLAPQEALQHLAKVEKDCPKKPEALISLTITKALHTSRSNNQPEAYNLLEEAQKQIGAQHPSVDPQLQAALCKTFAFYYKQKEQYLDFCKYANLYLSYTQSAEMSDTEKEEWAVNYIRASFIAEGFYNFGELLQTPLIKEHAKSSATGGLVELLHTVNEGSISAFDKFVSKNVQLLENTGLAKYLGALRDKVIILAFLECCFRMTSKRRVLQFAEVAKHCEIPEKQVEYLVMKAMSSGLITGEIDEVAQTIRVFWIKPRVLDDTRIDVMRKGISKWIQSAEDLLQHLVEATPELLIS